MPIDPAPVSFEGYYTVVDYYALKLNENRCGAGAAPYELKTQPGKTGAKLKIVY